MNMTDHDLQAAIAASSKAELQARLDAMSPQELEFRRREILDVAKGKYEDLSLDLLSELSFIVGSLRRRTAGPPKAAKAASKIKPTIDDLL